MAKVDFKIGLNIGVQSGQGTENDTIEGSTTLSSVFGVSDTGAILGHPESGEGRSGISFATSRGHSEKAEVTGSFTKNPSDFLREEITSFSVAVPLKGSGKTAAGPADSDMTPYAGIDAILQALGLTGAAVAGGDNGWVYTPNNSGVVYCTAKLWANGVVWVLEDCVASGSMAFEPNGIGLLTADFSVGAVTSFAEAAFPTSITYESQATLSATPITGVVHTFGTARGFSDFTLNFDNAIESVADSNSSVGTVPEQTARTISATTTIYADSADDNFEWEQMTLSAAPSSECTFTAGTVAVNAAEVNAYTVSLTSPEVRSVTPKRIGNKLAHELELVCVDETADTEFSFTFV